MCGYVFNRSKLPPILFEILVTASSSPTCEQHSAAHHVMLERGRRRRRKKKRRVSQRFQKFQVEIKKPKKNIPSLSCLISVTIVDSDTTKKSKGTSMLRDREREMVWVLESEEKREKREMRAS